MCRMEILGSSDIIIINKRKTCKKEEGVNDGKWLQTKMGDKHTADRYPKKLSAPQITYPERLYMTRSIHLSKITLNSKNNIKGTYNDENIVAYITGNPAKRAPPPMTNHTSFPSQTGPTAFNAILRLFSFFRKRCHAPAPKSKPSKDLH